VPLIPLHRAGYDKISWNVAASSKMYAPEQFLGIYNAMTKHHFFLPVLQL
jgi:hypothetical protein